MISLTARIVLLALALATATVCCAQEERKAIPMVASCNFAI
jgi:hypothetical protein